MTKFLIYLLLLGSVLYILSRWGQRGAFPSQESSQPKAPKWFKPKRNPREIWVQVYETASVEEARVLQARIQEEDMECVVYEQGKKDIHGNSLTGIGIAVPKTAMGMAQSIISRLLS
jgi:hypothetical protein